MSSGKFNLKMCEDFYGFDCWRLVNFRVFNNSSCIYADFSHFLSSSLFSHFDNFIYRFLFEEFHNFFERFPNNLLSYLTELSLNSISIENFSLITLLAFDIQANPIIYHFSYNKKIFLKNKSY